MTKIKRKFKKIALCILCMSIAFCLALSLAACNEGDTEQPSEGGGDVVSVPETQTFTVTFSSEGGQVYGTQQVTKGEKATLPQYTDAFGNAITEWYYKYDNGATETWSFAGYSVTEDMTLYAVENGAEVVTGRTYALEASLSAYINAMGGVEFGDGIFKSGTITELADGRLLLSMETGKSGVVIYTVSCDTFIDPFGTNAQSEGDIPNGTIGYYNADGELVTDGVTYTLSAEDDLVRAPDPEGGSNYAEVRYVTRLEMVLENVGALEDLNELELSFYVNSQVMGAQFSHGAASSSMSAAVLTITGMTEIEVDDEEITGITDAAVNGDGDLILTLSDGRTINAGHVVGADGAAGVGVSNITYAEGVLHIYLTNGAHYRFDLSGGEAALPDNVTETAASCTADGVRTTYTDASKTEVVGILTIERATGHTYENGSCSVCGAEQINDMTFTLNSDEQSYTLAAYNSRAWDTVVIPDTYEGLPVTGIADGETMMGLVLQSGVFMDHTEIKSVSLGANLTSIGLGAFSGASGLESIDLSGVDSLGQWSFQNCSSLTSAELNEGLTEIPKNAFYACSSLRAIALPEQLTSIGASAFYNCSSLESIDIPSGVTAIGSSAFNGCSSVTEVVVPASVTSIGTSAFANCASLAAVTINSGISSLPNTLFQNCTSLTRFNSDTDGLFDLTGYTSLGNSVFLGSAVQTVKFDGALGSVGQMAFQNCDKLSQLDFGTNTSESVTFGNQCFQNCTSLQNVSLPANTSTLGSYAFAYCTALTDIDLGSSLSAIPGNCFAGCVSLTEIYIPDSVTSTGTGSFSGCTALTDIVFGEESAITTLSGITGCTSLRSLTIPAGVTTISSCTGNYYLIEIINESSVALTAGGSDNGGIAMHAKNIVAAAPLSAYVQIGDYTLYRDGNSADEKWYVTAYGGTVANGVLDLPESFVTDGETIDSYAVASRVFYDNDDIVTVNVPAGVTSIGAYAFANCSALTDVNFAENSSLTEICAYAFQSAYSLRNISLPESLTSIGASAFADCYALKVINIPAAVTDIHSSSFNGCYLAEVYDLSADSVVNIPSALNVYTATLGQSALCEKDGFTFIYIPASDSEAAEAYLIGYDGSASVIYLPEQFEAGGETVTSYGIFAGAFSGRTFSAGVSLPSAVTSIGDYAFYRVDTMRISFTGTPSCTLIGRYAFAYSTVWMFNSDTPGTLDLGGVATVSEYAFSSTTRITSAVIADSVESLGGRVFEGSAVSELQFAEARETALALANYAFSGMTALESVEIPSYITDIPENLFRGCSSLSSVTLSEGVSAINNNAFYGCDALTYIVLPSTTASTTSSWSSSSGLENVYVYGAEEDFDALRFNSVLNVYYYSEEAPVNDGMFWHYGSDGLPEVWPMV